MKAKRQIDREKMKIGICVKESENRDISWGQGRMGRVEGKRKTMIYV